MADDDLFDTPLGGVLLGLICSFASTLTICLIIVAYWYFKISDQGRILLERFSRPGQFDEEQRFAVEEAEALQTMDPMQKVEYLRAKGKCLCRGFCNAGMCSAEEERVSTMLACSYLVSVGFVMIFGILTMICSLHTSKPARVRSDGHLVVTIPGHPGEGCVGLGV